jgi:hypothetical protein
MTKTLLALCLLASVVVVSACEPPWENDKEGLKKACAAAPAKMPNVPQLPGNFPLAKQLNVVSVQKDGPATVVSGWMGLKITPAHQAWSNTLGGASGWSITKEEQDAADSEVNFSGNGKSGQVKMIQECVSRTTVKITIRPA